MASEVEVLTTSKLDPMPEHNQEILQKNELSSHSNMHYLSLPSTLYDVQKLALKGVEHPGMTMVSNSLKAHRTSNKAIIFLYGMTGSGKSSTLNHLFNNQDLLKVSDNESCTKDVVEHVVTMTSDDCRVHNLEIGFIDAPGWADTDGTIQDAVNLASIAKFLQQHPLLSSKRHSFYPNIVLIVVSAVDKRFGGVSSSCAHMLRALSKLHVVDRWRPNVVFVLTNASSVPRGRYKDMKKSKTNQIQDMCRLYLGVSSPVVWIENDFVGNELEREGDWTFLLDREKQPLNLFEAMISIFRESRDDIGLEAVRMCFSGSCSNLVNPTINMRIPSRKVRSRSMSREVVLNDQEMNWHLILMKELKLLVKTEITQKLREYTESHQDIARYEQMTPMLTYLQEAGISKLLELETRTLQEIEILLKPFLINRTDKFILLEVFKVQYRSFLDIVQVVGCGYNIENSTISTIRIFDINTVDCDFDYNVGIYIPKCMDATLLQKTVITCTENEQPIHDTETHGTEVGPSRLFGFEIVHNLYTFKTNEHLAKIKHNKEILKSIEKLPPSALDNNNTVDPAYLEFFRLYGHLEVHSAVVSGRISGCVTIDNNCIKNIAEHQVCAILEEKITAIKNNLLADQNDNFLEVDFDIDNVPLLFAGGDPSHYCPTLSQLSHEKWTAWVDSILNNPIFHPEHYGMSPIYNLVKTIDSVKGTEMQIAYNATNLEEINRRNNRFYSVQSSNGISNRDTPDRSFVNLDEAKTRIEAGTLIKLPKNKNNSENNCFPGNASVTLRGGERVRMDELKIGDYVLSIHPTTGKPVYSKVYLWAHRDPHTTATFLHITHPHGHLHISANHLILSGDKRKPVPADQLRVGDSVHFLSPCLSQQQLDGEEGKRGDFDTLISVPVLHIQTCTQVGYYAPFTMNGYLIVERIATSIFSVTEPSMAQVPFFQSIGQSLFYPMRVLDRFGFGSIVGTYLEKDTKIHKYAQFLKDSYQVFKPLNNLFL